jgi:4-diphosphocytidyl-2-C-methyl-D-erythritol kinase
VDPFDAEGEARGKAAGVAGGEPARRAATRTEGRAVDILAHAKINLTLEVLRRRADGYHDIVSVMQAIDLADLVRLRVRPGAGIELKVLGADLPAAAGNLAWDAAAAWLRAAGPGGAGSVTAESEFAVEIELTKRIPIGAGLGGGSADAAAVLFGLNTLFDRPLGAAALYRLAARVGSDVPFFLAGGTCRASGRGEKLRRLPPVPPLWVVVVAPAVPVETQWAYAARSSEELTSNGAYSTMLESAIRKRSTSLIARHLSNDLERVVARRYGVVAETLEAMRAATRVACMSGSGSAVFALADEQREALRVAEVLRSRNHPVLVCRSHSRGTTCA